jgi:hypothetical protein
VTTPTEFGTWIEQACKDLPAQKAHAFRSIWDRGLLTVNGGKTVCDMTDQQSSALVWSALEREQRLLVVLPDFAEHRRAVLLATGLLYSWLHPRSVHASASYRQRVVYFGTHIGIREQLASVRLSSWQMKFSEAFPQYNLGRLGTSVATGSRAPQAAGDSSHTPEVTTVYSPADPQLALDKEKPDWVAIDIGDQARVPWLAQVLVLTRDRQIPVIGWGLNPLSDAIGVFKQTGLVYIWPLSGRVAHPPLGPVGNGNGVFADHAAETSIQPLVLSGPGIDAVSADLRRAVQELAATRTKENSLPRAAVLAHWRYLRSVEALAVPVDFHEAEAQKLYGLRSFHYLRQSCKSFQGHCASGYHEIVAKLEAAEFRSAAAVEAMRQGSPPLWRALGTLILDEPKNRETRYLAFTSRSRKQLFLLALLAYYNITESDLAEIGTVPVTLSELRDIELFASNPDTQAAQPAGLCAGTVLLTGVPSPHVTGNLLPCFSHRGVDVFVYEYQERSLSRRVVEWASRCNPDPEYLTSSLIAVCGKERLDAEPPDTRRVGLRRSVEFDAGSGRKTGSKPYDRSLLHGFDAADELSKLFSEASGDDETVTIVPPSGENVSDGPTDADEWCSEAVHLSFEQGWYGIFAPDERLYVVISSPEGPAMEQRYISAIRVNDRVLLIYGERRQSFYDLLISRVHSHPSFALHVALVKKWQDEIAQAYYTYGRRVSSPLTSLHRALQEEGSTISYSAVRLWLLGEILCPDDPQDLLRLGSVLHVPFVVSNYKRIHTAAKRLGGFHRALSRRLNSWLRSQALSGESSAESDIIDADLGITFEDFRSSLMLLRVTDKRPVSGPVFKTRLGRLERS